MLADHDGTWAVWDHANGVGSRPPYDALSDNERGEEYPYDVLREQWGHWLVTAGAEFRTFASFAVEGAVMACVLQRDIILYVRSKPEHLLVAQSVFCGFGLGGLGPGVATVPDPDPICLFFNGRDHFEVLGWAAWGGL
jgi:hypothetical protein